MEARRAPLEELRLRPPSPQQQASILSAFASLEFKSHAARLEALWPVLFPEDFPPAAQGGGQSMQAPPQRPTAPEPHMLAAQNQVR